MAASTPPPLPDSIKPISITSRSTRGANWRCNLYAVLHNKHFLLVIGACALLMSFTLPLPALSSNAPVNAALRLGVAVAALGFLNLIVLTLAILKRPPRADTIRMCTSSLTPDGLRIVTPKKSRLFRWKDITQIREHNGDIHVWAGVSGMFISREGFNNLDEARSFYQMATELWDSKGSSWPEVSSRPWRKS
jgi:hypothetical protein